MLAGTARALWLLVDDCRPVPLGYEVRSAASQDLHPVQPELASRRVPFLRLDGVSAVARHLAGIGADNTLRSRRDQALDLIMSRRWIASHFIGPAP